MTTDPIAAARALLERLTGYTPGPWYSDTSVVGTMIDDRYEWSSIATPGNVDRHHKSEKAANARLIAAAPDLRDMIATLADALEAERAARQKAEAERDVLKMRDDNHWETLRSIRYIAQTSGNLVRIIQWVDDAGSGYTETAEATLAQVMDERDQALARLAVAYDAVAQWHEETAAHDQGGLDYSDAVGISISNRYELEQSVKAHTYSAYAIRALTPADAQAALDKMLAEARLEGWRAGRDAALAKIAKHVDALRFSPITGHQRSASDFESMAGIIRALPEPKETNHD